MENVITDLIQELVVKAEQYKNEYNKKCTTYQNLMKEQNELKDIINNIKKNNNVSEEEGKKIIDRINLCISNIQVCKLSIEKLKHNIDIIYQQYKDIKNKCLDINNNK